MVKGLYAAHAGMRNEQNRMDVTTNNLANVNTTGFKKEGTVSQQFSTVLAYKIKDFSEAPHTARGIGNMNLGVKLGETYIDWSQGSFRATDNTFDLALSGKGFFNIEYTNKSINARRDTANQTSVMYTRDGNFSLTKDGELVTHDGDFVLDRNGNHIRIDPTRTDTSINTQGEIRQNGQVVANIGITDFENYDYLSRYGENMFEAVEGAVETAPTASVNSGYLEMSNVSAVDEMVNMIAIQRQYEANSTMIKTVDDTLTTSTTQVGLLK